MSKPHQADEPLGGRGTDRVVSVGNGTILARVSLGGTFLLSDLSEADRWSNIGECSASAGSGRFSTGGEAHRHHEATWHGPPADRFGDRK